MKKIEALLIVVVFLIVNLFGIANYSNADFNTGTVRKVRFNLSIEKLVNDIYYLNNKV